MTQRNITKVLPMALQSNPELDLAYEYVRYTNDSIFLTGKAGTGKTTFLHRIKNEAVKRNVVVAPTGVAAINAGGMTIHSFFQLPFGPYVPGNTRELTRQRKFSGKKIKLIRSLELLIIDEISMVRADLLDGIDDVLRRYKNPLKPFGGVQLLMIGDLHQLPPVVKDEEWRLLRPHYDTPYFFSSNALQQIRPKVVALKHIYRQSDSTFIDLLNKVRNNEVDRELLEKLNSRFVPHHQIREEDSYITLTTHNASAQAINRRKLEDTPGRSFLFKATITGDFPAHAYPTDEELELKVGAQVMFVKNDLSAEKRFYNGKIGKITRIEKDDIRVQCPGDERAIEVERLEWQNVKYSINKQNNEVSEDVAGTFTQYPLKLAWAITIHKSQGLTFERVILDAQAAFAHGQVYVALSRCKSFEGIVLRSKIALNSVKTDRTVKQYTEAAEKNAPGPAELEQSKIAFQQSLILDLFGFAMLKKYFERMNRVLLEHEKKLNPAARQAFETLAAKAKEEVIPVGEKFCRQLQGLFRQDEGLPEENESLQDRIRKGCAWFEKKFDKELRPGVESIQIITDNRKIRKMGDEALEDLEREIFVKQACFAASQKGFVTQDYHRLKINAELDFKSAGRRNTAAGPVPVARESPHPELYARLIKWRDQVADEEKVRLYQVLPSSSMLDLTLALPVTKAGLKNISGIGKGRVNNYGEALIAMIRDYCEANHITPPTNGALKSLKPDSKTISFELFRSGKNIKEIAKVRDLACSTIEGHLAHFVVQGELNVYDLVDKPAVEKIEAFFRANEEATLSEARAHFGEAYSYNELRMVRAYTESGN